MNKGEKGDPMVWMVCWVMLAYGAYTCISEIVIFLAD